MIAQVPPYGWNTSLTLKVFPRIQGAVQGKVRLLSKPSRWMNLHFLDIHEAHGILLCVIQPTDEVVEGEEDEGQELPPAAPRFSSLVEDELGKVLDCDDAFTQMFGYTPEDLIGHSVLDQMYPDDQGRVVEGWLAMLSTHRDQQTRLRRKRKDGSWMWVDSAGGAPGAGRAAAPSHRRDAGWAAAVRYRPKRRLPQRAPARDPADRGGRRRRAAIVSGERCR